MTIQNDITFIQAGFAKMLLITSNKNKKEVDQQLEKFMEEEGGAMINAGFRLVGSLFINLERLANAQEERLNHDAR